jgi:Cysteine rich repeat
VRSPIVAAVVAAVLLSARAARAEDPCAEDVKQFCGDVRIGRGRVQDCLRKNDANLSAACRAKRAAVERRFQALAQEYGAACQLDMPRLCSEVKPGGGRVLACLLRQLDDLSGSCRAVTERYQAAAETIAALRASCKADVEHLCPGVPNEAGAIIECIQASPNSLSEGCRAVDPEVAMRAAEIVDAVDALTSAERVQETQQILQGIESFAFSRSQVLFQVDSFQGLSGSANANRLLFNPQVVFGPRNEFAVQLRAPVLAVYPYAPDRPAQTGLGAVTTALAWAFAGSKRVHQYLSLGLQWKSPVSPPVGAAWALTPGYAITVGLARWLSITGQVAYIRSFENSGYPEVSLVLLDPIVVANLPGRSFVAIDTKLGWNVLDSSFLPSIKGIVGIYIDRKRSASISGWYQRSLSDDAERQTFKFGVGMALAYFFDF